MGAGLCDDKEEEGEVVRKIGDICRRNAEERGKVWKAEDRQRIQERATDKTGGKARGVRVMVLRRKGTSDIDGVMMYKPQEHKGEKVMYIHEIQIDAEARGRGKGREGLERCRGEAESMGKVGVMLKVAYENMQAREAYAAWGMEEGMSEIQEQEDGECYQVMQVIWEEGARGSCIRRSL